MSQFTELILKRLDDVRLTEAQRREAIISLQRAEQIADLLSAVSKVGRGLLTYARAAIALAARHPRRGLGAAPKRRDDVLAGREGR